jgi:hypothetical protein
MPGYFRVFRAERPEFVGVGSLRTQTAEGTTMWKGGDETREDGWLIWL